MERIVCSTKQKLLKSEAGHIRGQESEGMAITWENQVTLRKYAHACLKGKSPGIGSPRVLKRKSKGQSISC